MARLMARDPFELRPGETGHRLDANDFGQLRMVAREFVRLPKSAPVVVQDRGAHRLVGAIEEHRAVHLT